MLLSVLEKPETVVFVCHSSSISKQEDNYKLLEENPAFAQDFNLFLLRMKKGYFDWGTDVTF